MRWYGQLLVVGVLGAGAYFTHENWATVQTHLPEPVLNIIKPLLPAQQAAPQQQAGPGGGGRPGGGGGGGGQAPAVEVVPAARGTITEVTEAVGTTRAFESVIINSKASGIVESIAFAEGATVSAGQELLRIDSAERRADMEAAKAAIAQEEAKRNELKTKLERAQSLRRSGSGTEALVDDLTAQVKTADSAVQNFMARERATMARLNDMVVRAPFAGRVGVRQVSLGAFLDGRTPITTLDDISKVRLDFQAPENLMGRIQPDSAIKAAAAAFGARRFDGKVAVIDTRIDPVTRSVRLTAIVENADLALRPGMFMNVWLEVAKRENAVIVPEEAVVGEGPLQFVFVVKDNRIERRVVKLGQREPGKVEVVDGVAAGDQIVVRGVQRVRAGMQVTARPLGAAAPAGQGERPAGARGGQGAQGGQGQGGQGQGRGQGSERPP
ncbi:MAG: efflux RND transporter periplasmic adaptor subunit, partial [Beijerinckiaceae bacterium]